MMADPRSNEVVELAKNVGNKKNGNIKERRKKF
jgi:hypothetical protein